ncbi:MAG: GNAT family N-acetyltransferase [Aestuariivita sp.]|uniref:GNAT family N-acetyltransferase n=1 Tax=Aestuariivita sp. TaxID=1872407 RepID=UPI003BB13AE6
MNRTIPIINTARVSLRPMRPEDFDRFAEIWADPEVCAEIRGGARSRVQSWEAFLRNAGHWQMTGFGQWAIWESHSRRMVGQTGFFFANRDLGDDFDAFPEAGWVLARDAQGQGLAADATQAAHEWFDRVIHGPLVAVITGGHARSLSLAKRLGYRALRQTEMDGTPVVLMRRNGPP